ncbi:hypothetical protein ACG1VR_13865 [Cedecea davisae]|uniref:hypothetical protein n=1 Tax=Cedecea davisae TaxID=158484 RepID=UPI00376EEF9C
MFIRLNLFGRGSRGRKSGPGLSYVLSGMFFFGLFFVSNAAFALQQGLPGVVTFVSSGEAGAQWCDGQGTNIKTTSGATDLGHACVPTGADPWLMNAGTGVSFYSSFTDLLAGLYVPVKDAYVVRLWICDASGGPGECTMGQSVEHLDAATAVALDSSKTIEDQVPRWGGVAKKVLNYPFNACLTLMGSNGIHWRGAPGTLVRTCTDANALPDTPALCYINYGTPLDVYLGTTERRDIATAPSKGAGSKYKAPVLCTRDSRVDVVTRFEFEPIVINGVELVKTTASNTGVAIFYNGTLVDTTTRINESFEQGTTDTEYEFQLIRDPNVSVGEVTTGDFTAVATVIMTLQ